MSNTRSPRGGDHPDDYDRTAYWQRRAEAAEAEVDRARAAGRRLGAYWQTQADGEEAVSSLMTGFWHSQFATALGVPLGSRWVKEALEAIGQLRARAEAAEAELDEARLALEDAEGVGGDGW